MQILSLTVKGDHDTNYVIGADADGLVCSCPAWRYSKVSPQTCKHIAFVTSSLLTVVEA